MAGVLFCKLVETCFASTIRAFFVRGGGINFISFLLQLSDVALAQHEVKQMSHTHCFASSVTPALSVQGVIHIKNNFVHYNIKSETLKGSVVQNLKL